MAFEKWVPVVASSLVILFFVLYSFAEKGLIMLVLINFPASAACLFFFIKKTKPLSVKLPPGPNKLPIIGNLHLISSLPFHSLTNLSKQYGPIMHLQLGQVPAIVVSSPEIAKTVLKDDDPNFANRTEGITTNILSYNRAGLIFSSYGNYWRQMKKICMVELLSARNVRSFASIRNNEVSRLVDSVRLCSGQPLNLTEKLFTLMSSVTCRAAFGHVCRDVDQLINLEKEMLEMASVFAIADLFPNSRVLNVFSWVKIRLLMMRRKLDVVLDNIINEHRENLARMGKDSGGRRGNGEFGNEDLVDVLLRIKESGELGFPIDNDNIKAVIFDMFVGGTETTTSTIDWAMTELMRNPRVMAKAQAEVRQTFKGIDNINMIEEHHMQKLKYIKLIIKESLRLHSPAPVISRATREECEIKGYTIPAKVMVLVNIWGIQRNPEYWNNPESFKPERFEDESLDFGGSHFEYLPFGGGIRMCPGISFSMAVIELMLAQLLYHFNWELPNGVKPEDLNMIEKHGLSAPRQEDLFVVPTPHQFLA